MKLNKPNIRYQPLLAMKIGVWFRTTNGNYARKSAKDVVVLWRREGRFQRHPLTDTEIKDSRIDRATTELEMLLLTGLNVAKFAG